MDLLIEILFELIFEGSIELISNTKIPKWIRYPLIVLITLFFAIVIIGILLVGVFLLNENISAGLILIILGTILLVSGIKKFKKIHIERKNNYANRK